MENNNIQSPSESKYNKDGNEQSPIESIENEEKYEEQSPMASAKMIPMQMLTTRKEKLGYT